MKNQSSLPALLTACALFALVPLTGSATTYTWNQPTVGANNWNDNNNWNPSTGNPGSADTAIFGTNGLSADATTVNNVVSVNTAITALTYNQTNTTSPQWHVTQIPSGITLTVSGAVTVGGVSSNSIATSVAMTGGGTFLATGTPFAIGNNAPTAGTSSGTLDLSGLSNFVYNASAGSFNLGTNGSRGIGNITLAAASNSITAGTINLNTKATSTATTGTMNLGGGTNIINAGTINVAAGRNITTIQFSGATGGLRLRGTGGTDTDRATIVLGNRDTGGTSSLLTTGNILANGHPVDMKLATLTMGTLTRNGTEVGFVATGVCQFDQGTVDATTINMAVYPGTSPSSSAIGILTVGANGALIIGAGGLSLANIGASAGAGAIATGNLNIFGGTATCAGSITKASTSGTGNIVVSNGTLNVSGTIGSASVPVDNFSVSNATLTLPAAASANATVTALNSGGTTNTINVSSVPAITVYPTQFPLIKYAGASGDLAIIGLGTLPGIFQGYVSNNTGNLSIDVVLTSGPPPSKPVTWNGTVNGNWDTTTANWKSALLFNQNDFSTFDDTASGTTTVNLTTAITPGSLTINNSTSNYTFSGVGGLSGSASLVKQGTGTLILDNSGVNNFSGGVLISGGTLQFGNNDANGNLPATGSVTDNGSLVISRSDSITLANGISGSGSLTNKGNGTLTLSAANSFSGDLTVNAGTVRPTNVRAPGTGTLTVNSGGALVLMAGITNAITLAGGTLGVSSAADFTGPNTILRAAASTTSIVQTADPQNPSTTRNIQIDGVLLGSGNILVIGATNVSSVDGGQGFRLRGTTMVSDFSGTITLSNNVKGELLTSTNATFSPAGTGKFKLVCGAFDGTNVLTGPITGGYSEFNLRNNSVGNAVLGNDVEVIGSGTTILDPIGSAPVGAALTMGNLKVGGGQEVGVYLSAVPNHVLVFPTVTLTGGNAKFSPKTPGFGSLTSVGSDLSLGDISEQTAGSGIIMAGWRTLFLTGTNTYSGNTVVSSGTLALTGSASISNTPNITIASNAKLDVSGLTTTFSLGSGQTLTGSGATGTINSNVNMNLGSLALNYTNGTPTLTVTNGTLTFNNNATAVTVLGATPLAVGSYRLVSAGTGGAVAGSVNTAPTVNGAGVVAGHAVSLSIISGELYLVVTNRNPLANPSTYSRPAGFSLKIPIIGNLATNWSDPDGDTVTLTSSISSTNGATVSYDNNYVYYSNPHNVTDQIAYTVGDVWGGTAPGMINIGIVASAGGVAQNISTVGGVVTVKFSGIPNFRYDIERATDVNFTANLTVLITTNAPANGQFQFTDNSPPQPAAFYRLKYNP